MFLQNRSTTDISDQVIHLTRIMREDEIQEDANDRSHYKRRLDDEIDTLLKPRESDVRARVI